MRKNHVKPLGITEKIVSDALVGILVGEWQKEDTALESVEVEALAEADTASHGKGLTLTLPDGTEFQLTIVQTK